MRPSLTRQLLALVLILFSAAATPSYATTGGKASGPLSWQPWSKAAFAEAKAEKKLVLLDVEAVWCHWCHVMDEVTYRDPEVVALLRKHFVLIRVDQDANPEISTRYRDYGWPATIFFAADGTELLKKRGFIRRDEMRDLLTDLIKNPTPRISSNADLPPATSAYLNDAQRQAFLAVYEKRYDAQHGGWGNIHRFIDAATLEYTVREAAAGNVAATKKAKQTLDSARLLIDPVWGGVYQYSDELDWRSPHFEKIMSLQAANIKSYADAYRLWGNAEYKQAANDVRRYLTSFLRSPEGAFYTSQDADVNQDIDGHQFFKLDDKARRKLGMPRIDKNMYANENGRAIDALLSLYDATGDAAILAEAKTAADWIIKNRQTREGGFRHGEAGKAALYVNDTAFMGQALLHLYMSSGERRYLKETRRAADYILAHFVDAKHKGFLNARIDDAHFVINSKPVKDDDENILIVRFLTLLSHASGEAKYHAAATEGMKYLASENLWGEGRAFYPGVMLADQELANAPLHITIVGGKGDAAALALHQAALAYPANYKRVDWWDRAEGPMPNPDITYPELPKAAAFACTARSCSLPIFSPADIAKTVREFTGR